MSRRGLMRDASAPACLPARVPMPCITWVLRNAYIEAGIAAHEDGTAGVVSCRWTATSHNYADDQPWDQPSSRNRVTLDSGSSGDWLVLCAVEAKASVVSSRLTRSRAAGVIFTRQNRHVSCGMGDSLAMRRDYLPKPLPHL